MIQKTFVLTNPESGAARNLRLLENGSGFIGNVLCTMEDLREEYKRSLRKGFTRIKVIVC